MSKFWRVQPHDTGLIMQLEKSAGISSVVAQLLLGRGISRPDEVRQFLDVRMNDLRDPFLLPGMTAAVDRLMPSLGNGDRITVYGDYDADGMTSTAILVRCLQALNANVNYYVPNRLEEGYGLHDDAMRKLHERGTSLVISVDCGIASLQAAQVARDLGLGLIITDHHEMGTELPVADAIVHPRLPGHSYPFDGLCGAGVAFKLAWALCQRVCDAKRVSERLRTFLLSAMGLAAIGTVADVVPLLDENRILVRHGLKSLKHHPPLGLAHLMRVAQLTDKSELSSDDIAFSLGPRLNAAGRLGQAQLGVELMITQSEERADQLATYIDELNRNRDSLERSIYLSALKQAQENFDPDNDPALVLSDRGWHVGVIGIVAGRLAEKFHRPVIMIGFDSSGEKVGVGSCRTAHGLALFPALQACSEHLNGFGGHAAAAGLRITESQVDAFRRDFCDYVSSNVTEADRIAELWIDAEAPLGQLTYTTVQQMDQLAPFGQGNPRPLLCASGVQLAGEPKKMGKGERHLSAQFKQHGVTVRSVAFQRAEWADELVNARASLDIAYRPVINEYMGRRNVEVQLVDWRPSALNMARSAVG